MKIEFVHRFEVDRDSLERLWADPAAGKRIGKKLPGVKARELLEEVDDGKTIRRKVRMTGQGEIPEAARKVIQPEMLTWIEETVYDKATHVYHFSNTSVFFKDRVECRGTVAFVDDPPTGCRRELNGVLEVKVPLVGRLAESIIFKNLERNWARETELLEEIVSEHKAKTGARARGR